MSSATKLGQVAVTPAGQTVPVTTAFILVAYTICYFCFALSRAANQPLWLDEVSTLWMCRLPDLRHIWSALATNAPDTAPPAFYAITRALITLTGDDRLGLRLLPVMGFYVAQIGIFLFARARLGHAAALFAMLLPVASGALHYATDGRPYAAVFGCFAMAAWFWQSCGEDARWRQPAGLWLSLSLAIALHFFAVFILIPIAAAEFVRTLRNRRIAWPCWAAILASVLPLLVYLPLIGRIRSLSLAASSAPAFYARPTATALIDAYQELLAPPGWGMLVACAAVLFLAVRFFRASPQESSNQGGFSLGESALAIALVLFPILVFVLARVVTHTFHIRYTLPALFGYSIVAALLVSLLPHATNLARAFSFLLLLIIVVAAIRELGHHRQSVEIDLLQTAGNDLPIVVSEGKGFIELRQNAPPLLRDRLVYLTSPAGVSNPDPTNENIVKNWAAVYPLPVYPASEFLAAHRAFMLYHTGASSQTITDWLSKNASNVAVAGHKEDKWLFLVSR